MNKHISFGKISDYSALVKNITRHCRFDGLDEDGNAIYNNDPLPTLEVRATVKQHGSNSGVSLQNGEIVCQSRKRIVKDGHFSFPEIVCQEKDTVLDLFEQVKDISDHKDGEIITIYGEIIGPGIQKSVALNDLKRKYWVFFACKITNSEGEGRWVRGIENLKSNSDRIHNIYDFPNWVFNIDFNQPKNHQNDLVETMLKVEEECPVAKQLENISGIGEGIVLETFIDSTRFTAKVKGDKHAKGSKIKKTAQLDPVKLRSIQDFVDHAATQSRIEQAIHEVGKDCELEKKHTGQIIKWVSGDIVKEEAEVLKENELEYREVAGNVSTAVRIYFHKYLEKQCLNM